MTAEQKTEWVLVPRVPTPEMVQASNEISCRAEGEEHWAAMLAAAPPPADAEPKTLPVPTRVYLTDKAAVIVGDPQHGWDEEGPDAHNCDAMGCASIGPHVLARVPFTDERALPQPAEGVQAGEDDCRCIDCGGNQPGHDPTCSYMHKLHGEQAEQRARELLAAEYGDDPCMANKIRSGTSTSGEIPRAIRAIARALSQQPEARGVVDEDFVMRMNSYLGRNYGVYLGKTALIAALTEARNVR
jgi:hypothetical protein